MTVRGRVPASESEPETGAEPALTLPPRSATAISCSSGSPAAAAIRLSTALSRGTSTTTLPTTRFPATTSIERCTTPPAPAVRGRPLLAREELHVGMRPAQALERRVISVAQRPLDAVQRGELDRLDL